MPRQDGLAIRSLRTLQQQLIGAPPALLALALLVLSLEKGAERQVLRVCRGGRLRYCRIAPAAGAAAAATPFPPRRRHLHHEIDGAGRPLLLRLRGSIALALRGHLHNVSQEPRRAAQQPPRVLSPQPEAHVDGWRGRLLGRRLNAVLVGTQINAAVEHASGDRRDGVKHRRRRNRHIFRSVSTLAAAAAAGGGQRGGQERDHVLRMLVRAPGERLPRRAAQQRDYVGER
mmetsp:Transcript_17898/g.54784  ORF Transcript_17898/g.54784 Transcript_17898/m.54784 type:complete len:230 (+) Transcript_17898:1585-2274(+)